MDDDPRRRGRRDFLAGASASAFVLAAHRHLTWAAPIMDESERAVPSAEARIQRLKLLTAAPLDGMKSFYHETLGLPVLQESSTELTIGGGTTPITFVRAQANHGKPFYHFAFNIPENKLLMAREWQLERTDVIPIFPDLRDPSYPHDVIHFRSWNAHSIYFFDPAGNVLEYIARHDLDNGADGPFTVRDILYASEIAFIVDDVSALAGGLQGTFGLAQYRQGSDAFRALGDEQGLLLVFQRGRDMTRGLDHPTPADVFPTEASIRSGRATEYLSSDFPYRITTA